MKSKPEKEEESVELSGNKDGTSNVIVDDFKDLEIEMIASSRKNFLQWNGLDN